MRTSPASRARWITASRSSSKALKSRWQCVSVRFMEKARGLYQQDSRSMFAQARDKNLNQNRQAFQPGGFLLLRSKPGDPQPIVKDRLDLILVGRLAVDTHDRL